ncbi:MAG: hypothetical protein WCK58_15745 [Chloroflexota bacterium]
MTRVDRRPAPLPPAPRLALLALGGASLLAGLLGALTLLGFPGPGPAGRLAGAHGMLMPMGFLGTLIALERAVAFGRPWGYVAPAAAGLAGLALIAGAPPIVATSLLLAAALVYLALYAVFVRMDGAIHTWVQAMGAVGWLCAAAMLQAGRPVGDVVPALAVLLILTIAGERLELARLVRLTGAAKALFLLAAGAFTTGAALASASALAGLGSGPGLRIAGAGLLGLAVWLARFDVARRTVRLPGVTRYIAVCLLAGYVWLAVGGAAWLAFGAGAGPLERDAMLHALFLGFVMSMVFGHAPVILPAVLRVPLPWHRWFYGHLALLHAGLLVRVGGDLAGVTGAWQLGGVLTVTAVLLFVAASAGSSVVATMAMRRTIRRLAVR